MISKMRYDLFKSKTKKNNSLKKNDKECII